MPLLSPRSRAAYSGYVKSPSTQARLDAFDSIYVAGLALVILLSSLLPDFRPEVLAFGPIVLTVALLGGQAKVMRRAEAQASGARPSHLWGKVLLLYMAVALVVAGLGNGLGLSG